MSKTHLDSDDIAKLEKAAQYARDRLLVRLLFRLSCRISEALSLTMEVMDFIAGIVRIQHLKSRMRFDCPDCGTALGKKHSYYPSCGKKVASDYFLDCYTGYGNVYC